MPWSRRTAPGWPGPTPYRAGGPTRSGAEAVPRRSGHSGRTPRPGWQRRPGARGPGAAPRGTPPPRHDRPAGRPGWCRRRVRAVVSWTQSQGAAGQGFRLHQFSRSAGRMVEQHGGQDCWRRGTARIRLQSPSPQGFRIPPDPGLLPGPGAETGNRQRGDATRRDEDRAARGPGSRATEKPADGSPGEQGEAQAREIAVAVVGELEPGMHHPADRQDHQGGVHPRGQPCRPPGAGQPEEGSDRDHADGGPQEAPRQRVHRGRQLVHGRESERPDPGGGIEPEAVGHHRGPGLRAVRPVGGDAEARRPQATGPRPAPGGAQHPVAGFSTTSRRHARAPRRSG